MTSENESICKEFSRYLHQKFNIKETGKSITSTDIWNDMNEKKLQKKDKHKGEDRCQARIWNNGFGGQCSKKHTNGSEFCLHHASLHPIGWCRGCYNDLGKDIIHKYNWEHNGRITDPEPKWMLIESEKRKKKLVNNNNV